MSKEEVKFEVIQELIVDSEKRISDLKLELLREKSTLSSLLKKRGDIARRTQAKEMHEPSADDLTERRKRLDKDWIWSSSDLFYVHVSANITAPEDVEFVESMFALIVRSIKWRAAIATAEQLEQAK